MPDKLFLQLRIAVALTMGLSGLASAQLSSEPVPVTRPPPVYPADGGGLDGFVDLDFTIAADGSVKDIKVSGDSEPAGLFDQSAIDAVSQWRFKPRLRNGQPVDARAKTRICYKYNGPHGADADPSCDDIPKASEDALH